MTDEHVVFSVTGVLYTATLIVSVTSLACLHFGATETSRALGLLAAAFVFCAMISELLHKRAE